MLIFHKAADLSKHLNTTKNHNSIGFVPTMGALHEGHLSLIKVAKEKSEIVVCSIFVNPTQFNNADDLAKYPKTTEQDITLLTKAECDILYLPEVEDVYPDGMALKQTYELGNIEQFLEGTFRPGHFQGVCQVVDRLLNIVNPTTLFLGQKDLQQVTVLTIMSATHHPNITIITVPTMREADGLAMSSRNRRLNIVERSRAPLIYQCLVSIKTKNGIGSFPIVQKECIDLLEKKGFRVDYIQLIDRKTFEPLSEYDATKSMAALIAAYNGDVRLIDNILM